ncbi:MAG: branched-chain amino acid transport system II carrier protein [Alphaproteobacteria bacterium]|jgi:LIVCS family branched-chain amino acid:cation transporter
MSTFKITLTTGLAMFDMFFGSGNLVFHLKIGMQSGNQYMLASIGLILTGIMVPFLGLFNMILYQGNKDQYFGLLGRYGPFTLSLLMLSFRTIWRSTTVYYSSLWRNKPAASRYKLPYF